MNKHLKYQLPLSGKNCFGNNDKILYPLSLQGENIFQKEVRLENLFVPGFLKPQCGYYLKLLSTSLIVGRLDQLWSLGFPSHRSQETQRAHEKWKADFNKCIWQFEFRKMSTDLCTASLVFQTMINGLLFTRVYLAIGCCHTDVPLPGYFLNNILVYLVIKTLKNSLEG